MHHVMIESDTHATAHEVRAVLALQTTPLTEADPATDVVRPSTLSLAALATCDLANAAF